MLKNLQRLSQILNILIVDEVSDMELLRQFVNVVSAM
jgi:nucleoside-triphosphatase THEP1